MCAPAAGPPPRLPPLFEPPRSRLLRVLVAIGLLQAGLAVVAALGMRTLFDVLGGPGSATGLASAPAAGTAAAALAIGALAAAAALVNVVLRRWAGAVSESLGQQYVAAVRIALLQHLFTLPPRRHQRMRHGHLMARLTGDLGALRRWAGRTVAPLLAGGASFVVLSAALAWLAPAIALAAALVCAPLLAGGWWVSARLEKALRAERAQRWALAGQLGERLAEAAVVQAHGQAARELGRLRRRQERLQAAAVRRAREAALLKALPPASATLLLGLLAGWGSMQVAGGHWSTGTLAGLLTLLGLALAPLRDFAIGLGGWRHWRVSREKLAGFLCEAPLAAAEPPAPDPPRGVRLVLAGVRAMPGLVPVTLSLGATDTLALQGGSGSGKSSLLLAAAGLLVPSAGRVTLPADGAAGPAREGSAGRGVALVGSDLPLLRGSVGANLRYRNRRLQPVAMQQALELCGVRVLAAGAALSLDSPVAEGGRNLPRVLRARLALARAVASAPAVLLVDDFDDLLDGRPEADAPLAALLRDPPCAIVIATRRADWAARCARQVLLDAAVPSVPAHLPEPADAA